LTAVNVEVVTLQHQSEFLKIYQQVYSSKEEAETFYRRFLENGWVSGAWKSEELIGVVTWMPREDAKHGLAEIIDFWVKTEERRKGIGRKLIDHAICQMQMYYQRFGATLRKVMLFTEKTDRFLAARTLYEKKGFQVVARIPRNAINNPDGDDLLYVLEITPQWLFRQQTPKKFCKVGGQKPGASFQIVLWRNRLL